MKRNYNSINKGKVIPLTEVKPGMVFRIVSDRSQPVVGWLFWCNADGVLCTDIYMACHKYLHMVVMGMTIGSTQQIGTKH